MANHFKFRYISLLFIFFVCVDILKLIHFNSNLLVVQMTQTGLSKLEKKKKHKGLNTNNDLSLGKVLNSYIIVLC